MIPRLAYITDGERGTGGRPLLDVIRAAAAGGVELVVLRELAWDAAEWRALCEALAPQRAAGLRVLASRRLDLVRAFRLDGVHLAADSVPVREARDWLGPEALIGYSAHSGPEAAAAAAAGASYVTLSPIYETGSKPGAAARGGAWLAEATRRLDIPALALGGVTAARVAELAAAGAWGVAAVSAIGAAPDPESAAAEFRGALSCLI